MATIIDIAREAGVSPSLVSYVLNKRTPIKKDLHKRILQIAQNYNYVPNSTARSMVTGRTNNILFVVSRCFLNTMHEAYFHKLLLYMVTQLTKRNLGMQLYASEENSSEELSKVILSRRADGIVWYLSEIPDEIRDALEICGCPTVLMLRGDERFSCVRCDEYDAERRLLEAAVSAGHRKIAYFGTADSERYRAYADLMQRHGLGDSMRVFIPDESDYISVRTVLHTGLAENPLNFTCIAAEKDTTAIHLINAFAELGIKVPGDVSVIGYDNIDESERYDLTTVSQDYRTICDETIEILVKLIENPDSEKIDKLIAGEVIVRDTLKIL